MCIIKSSFYESAENRVKITSVVKFSINVIIFTLFVFRFTTRVPIFVYLFTPYYAFA